MNAVAVYTLLDDACRLLDGEGDHAIAAYVGLAMALLADKYDIESQEAETVDGPHPAHLAKNATKNGRSWT